MTPGQADSKLIQLLIPGEKVLDINKGYVCGQCVAQSGLMLFGSRPGQQPRLGCPMGEERTQMRSEEQLELYQWRRPPREKMQRNH